MCQTSTKIWVNVTMRNLWSTRPRSVQSTRKDMIYRSILFRNSGQMVRLSFPSSSGNTFGTMRRQPRLIESLLLNIPVPPLFFSETKAAKYEVVDGHQRVTSIIRFLDNQFALSGLRISQEFKGLRFFRLPDAGNAF